MAEEVFLVFTTWPDLEKTRFAVRELVEKGLAACGNIVPGVESIYRWQGKIETSTEVMAIFKTTIGKYPQLESAIKALHSYEVPEIVCLRATDGNPVYLRWIEQSCAAQG